MANGLPSGEQIEIDAGSRHAVVVEVGAGLRSYTVDGREVLDGYGEGEMAVAGRGQMLIPWPNRLDAGAYEFAGRRHQLPLTEPLAGNAIHGLVRWANWSVGVREADRVVMEYALHPQPGYPFSLALSIEYSLSGAGLRVATSATNVGSEPCPYGCGSHPYLTVGTETVDAVLLRAPGRTVLQVDERGIPIGARRVDGTEYDFRQAKQIGATKLDNAYTDLDRDDDGLARVELRRPDDGGATVSLWLDAGYPYLTLFTGDAQPSVARRSLAVEPLTCPPNAFRSGESVVALAPGESTTSVWGIEP
jgi:aldose 1-epimerase